MSRRLPNPAAERAAQNQQTLKTLVKVESNNSCADCKRNKHPRWASWNLGIFICIRCSGIHRGMGTHISRVKSVDLDSWTDEQLQSMLKWGNARANKYWEDKLAPGHVPSEAKIENFIRTKYDSKRWAMEGPIPDPSTLDDGGDDEVPLNVVQEKAKLERSASLRAAAAQPKQVVQPQAQKRPEVDFFGDSIEVPARSNSAAPTSSKPPPTPPKPQNNGPKAAPKSGAQLLGFDFFGGGTQSAPPSRPGTGTSQTTTSGSTSRPDLKQSILSLYARSPAPAPATTTLPSQTQPGPENSGKSAAQSKTSHGLDDIFGGLSFGAPAAKSDHSSKPSTSTFSPTNSSKATSTAPPPAAPDYSAFGGDFFSPKTAAPPKATNPTPVQRTFSSSSGFGDFASASPIAPSPSMPTATNNGLTDLVGFGDVSQAPQPVKTSQPQIPLTNTFSSPFNLSAAKPTAPQTVPPSQTSSTNATAGFAAMDPWASENAWDTPATNTSNPAPAPPIKSAPAAATVSTTTGDWGWQDNPVASNASGLQASAKAPEITADEDFGGWETNAPKTPTAPIQTSTNAPKQAGGFGGGGDELFSNVWD